MKLINLTPHAVTIYQDGQPVLTIPADGRVARCTEGREDYTHGPLLVDGVPVRRTTVGFGAVTDLPGPKDGVTYIVSTITGKAAAETGRTDLVSPDLLVRDDTGRILGCEALAVAHGH